MTDRNLAEVAGPPGLITGSDLVERLLRFGWTEVKSDSRGFRAFQCPVAYDGWQERDAGASARRGVVSFEPPCPFSVWMATKEVLELEACAKQALCEPRLALVPWIVQEPSQRHDYCMTCGAGAKTAPIMVWLGGHLTRGGGARLCIACAKTIGTVAAAVAPT